MSRLLNAQHTRSVWLYIIFPLKQEPIDKSFYFLLLMGLFFSYSVFLYSGLQSEIAPVIFVKIFEHIIVKFISCIFHNLFHGILIIIHVIKHL